MEKPTVFIGSSTEGLKIAEAVFSQLTNETKPKLWTHQLFLPGQYPLEILEKQLKKNDFAILIASPDDQIFKRGKKSPAMRDNLLLEFGLFSGALGRKRAFFICPDTPQIDLPSDLLGLITAVYDGNRIGSESDEIAAAVQVACQQIRSVIKDEWELIQDESKRKTLKIRASERCQAIERLHKIVTQLRDTVMVVQRDAFDAISDENKFRKVKNAAKESICKIAASFENDSKLIKVNEEVEELVRVTSNALADIPFPRELSMGKEATRQKVINTGLGALNTFLGGGDPFQHVENEASNEADMRVSSLKHRYLEWWENHYPIIEDATNKLQERLFQSAIELASIAYHE